MFPELRYIFPLLRCHQTNVENVCPAGADVSGKNVTKRERGLVNICKETVFVLSLVMMDIKLINILQIWKNMHYLPNTAHYVTRKWPLFSYCNS